MRLCIMILCQPFSKSKLLWLLTRFDISRPDLTFRDQNCWFYSNPESTVWMVCVFSRMAIPILTTRINKVGPRINKVGPRINKGGPRINKGGPRIPKVGKPETTNRVARPICWLQQMGSLGSWPRIAWSRHARMFRDRNLGLISVLRNQIGS